MKQVPCALVTSPVDGILDCDVHHLCESAEIKHSPISCVRELVTYRQAAREKLKPRVNDGTGPQSQESCSAGMESCLWLPLQAAALGLVYAPGGR